MRRALCEGYLTPLVIPKVKKVIVFGDIHGDYNLVIRLLLLSDLITETEGLIKWTGENTHLVQVGDQIDRCRPTSGVSCYDLITDKDEASDIRILKLFTELDSQAILSGGRVISLLGNHEIMNALGDLSYTSRKGIDEFVGYVDNTGKTHHSGISGRAAAFRPGGEYGKFLGCTRNVCVIIGSNLFMHAGVTDSLNYGLDELESLNDKVGLWLLGILKESDVSDIIYGSERSPLWLRTLGLIPSGKSLHSPECAKNISKTIKSLKIGSIIVGHTPQLLGSNETCDGAIWRVDTALSDAFSKFGLKNKLQFLKIINDSEFTVCSED